MRELFAQGGPLMYGILLLSIAGLTVIIERLYYFIVVERANYEELKENIKNYLERKDIDGAINYCRGYNNSVARILETILENSDSNRDVLEEEIRETILERIPFLERYMWILGMAANVTPLVGLLGTVTGMIKAFNVISNQGIGKPEMLAGGISQALITTAAGLTVAIPALIMYNYFNKKIDSLTNEMEKTAVEFLNILG
ncbi:MotA/TolQ/ExbB proton channel family protein [Haliovirga abyssi]|uniref:Biopolymer transporter ExbB n=1 Tax=Haliovirga abyssi TaxID=2996794 RepID=A0AAU9D4T6_9FUSO|nr:MotA/TolQ/ExbB proton channel family protein [Haliovirga abyssi]BDU50974.1 biopolymer transporter ExbB [Haliovirga abyssi]